MPRVDALLLALQAAVRTYQAARRAVATTDVLAVEAGVLELGAHFARIARYRQAFGQALARAAQKGPCA